MTTTMDHAVTATQKAILKAFRMDAASVRSQAMALIEDIASSGRKENE